LSEGIKGIKGPEFLPFFHSKVGQRLPFQNLVIKETQFLFPFFDQKGFHLGTLSIQADLKTFFLKIGLPLIIKSVSLFQAVLGPSKFLLSLIVFTIQAINPF